MTSEILEYIVLGIVFLPIMSVCSLIGALFMMKMYVYRK